MSWSLPFPMRTRFAGEQLFVGEWSCEGGSLPPAKEVAHDRGVDLLQVGTHVRTLGRHRRVMSAAVAALPRPGDEYWVSSPPRLPQRGTVIFVRGALSEAWATVGRPECELSASSARLHARLTNALEPTEVEETALALLSTVALDAQGAWRSAASASSRPAQRLAEALQHVVASRFRERLTVEEMARACGVSAFHASRVFRAVTGQTLHRHLTRVRLWAALFELRERALAEVAISVGFSSHSHFTSAFKAAFGRPPTAMLRDEWPRARSLESAAGQELRRDGKRRRL